MSGPAEPCDQCPVRGEGIPCFALAKDHRGLCHPMHRDWVAERSRAAAAARPAPASPAPAPRPAPAPAPERPPCRHLGGPILAPDGKPETRACGPCGGKVRLKVFTCRHPAHEATTARECARCPDHEPAPLPGAPPVAMVAPGQPRPVWRQGILQIHVTRACDLACHHCTQGSNLAGRPVVMTPDEFEAAVRSLGFGVEGATPYFGVVGMFGGNPAMHPQFDVLCEILRAHVPFVQRGLWCNHPRGKGRVARITFNPAHSNLNCHLNPEAHAEFARDWPESIPHLKGMDRDSVHGPPFVALKDVVPDVAERWKLIGDCDVNRYWSALIGVVPGRGLRAYFCELAYAQAALHAGAADAGDWPDTGLAVEPGWWRRPMADFADQVRLHCHSCGIPLRRAGQLAIGGGREEFSATHAAIARPKARGRPVELVTIGGPIDRPARPATEYLPGTTPRRTLP